MKRVSSTISNALNKVLSTRIAKLILLCVFLSIYFIGFLVILTTYTVSGGIVSNTKLLVKEKNSVVVRELKSNGSIVLENGTVIEAKNIQNTYPITALSQTRYIKAEGLFLPTSTDAIENYLIGYVYIITLFFLTFAIVYSTDSYIKLWIKRFFVGLYLLLLVGDLFTYTKVIEAFLDNKRYIVLFSFLQIFLIFLRLAFIVQWVGKFSLLKRNNLGIKIFKK